MAHCFYKNCSFKAMFLCSCSGVLPICYMHLAAHKTSEIPNPHEIRYLFLAEYKETKIFIIDLINKRISMLWNSCLEGAITIYSKIKEFNEKLAKNIQKIDNEEFLLSNHQENKENIISELDEFKISQILSNSKQISNLEKALSEYCRKVHEKINTCYSLIKEIISIDRIPYENPNFFQSILLEEKSKAAELIETEILNNLNISQEIIYYFPRVSITTETEIVEKLKNKAKEALCFENQLEDLSKRIQALFTMSFTGEYKQLIKEIEQVKIKIANKFRVFSFICKNDECFTLVNETNKDFKKIYNEYVKKNYNNSKLCENLLKTVNENLSNFACFENKSLYLIDSEKNSTKIFKYNIKTRKKDQKIIASPLPLTRHVCVVQISNFELFLFGSFPASGAAFIFDTKKCIFKAELPEGVHCCSASEFFIIIQFLFLEV
ncbi:unnamed protein product [Blepharisma stoltei]|uniref:Uncharacterized protein n=1 Tax=Blepharisma stoltei TaxID=1481888 RepID=A0AAU9I8H1_9CILI|nr:unnamed protein product [Blepharisma stoltei]